VGNIIERTDPNGSLTNYSYDALNRLVNITYPVGSISKDYDAVGNTIQFGNIGIGLGDITDRTYDALNRIASETINYGSFTKIVSYTYDPVGNIIELVDPDGLVITYNYDGVNQLVEATDPFSGITDILYDPSGNGTETDLPNGEWSSSTYDNLNRLTDKTTKDPLNITLFDYDYAYDGVGQILDVYKNGLVESQYNYNANNWITDADYPITVQNIHYTYDAVGNRLSQDDNGSITSFTYSLEERVTSQTFPDLSSIVYTYDNNGNVIQTSSSWGIVSYNYDYENRLTTINYPVPYGYITNYYSPEGNRLARDERGQITYFFPTLTGNIVEMDALGNTTTRLNPGISQAKDVPKDNKTKAIEITYCHWDGNNSTTHFTGNSIVASFTFDYFGGMLNSTGNIDDVDPGLYACDNKVDWDPMLGAELIGIDYAPDIDQDYGNTSFAPIDYFGPGSDPFDNPIPYDHFEPGSEPFEGQIARSGYTNIYRNDRKQQDISYDPFPIEPDQNMFIDPYDHLRNPYFPSSWPWWCSYKGPYDEGPCGYMIGTIPINFYSFNSSHTSVLNFQEGEGDKPAQKKKKKCGAMKYGDWVRTKTTEKIAVDEDVKTTGGRAYCRNCKIHVSKEKVEVTYQWQVQEERTQYKCTLMVEEGKQCPHHWGVLSKKDTQWVNIGKPFKVTIFRYSCGCVKNKR